MARLTDPTGVATAWMDLASDDEAGLLWNPPGAFTDVTEGPRTVHLVRETAWYAIGLLRRDGQGDRARAARALAAVLAHQYDARAHPWHGTFVRFPEWPAPTPGAFEWVDYDPNWRQFVGTALAVAITDFDLPASLERNARAAVDLAVDAEPPERVPPTYANIALMRAWLEAWSGRSDRTYATAIGEAFNQRGCFIEHNSPTYYGIDLLALGLWQRADAPIELRELGASIEVALWTDIARWWHAGLGNLCGPYSRAYGMDLHAYVGGLSLALWCAGLPAPLPDLAATVVPHGHDLCEAPMLEHVGVRVPHAVQDAFRRFAGTHRVQQVVADHPHRLATAWLDDGVMLGAEADASGPQARGQRHPATIHWAQPDGQIGWLRLTHHGPTMAWAEPGRLEVECQPHARRGAQELGWETNVAPMRVTQGHWWLPGLEVEVGGDAVLLDPTRLTYGSPSGGPTRMILTLA